LDELINDEVFKDSEINIIDEAMTFFFAGMVTLKSSTTNMLVYLTRQPELMKKLVSEID